MTITFFSSFSSTRVSTSFSLLPYVTTPDSFQTRPSSIKQQKFAVFFCHSQTSFICLRYLSLPNLYFNTIRSMTMFLKVLTKFQSNYTNLNYFLLLTYSCLQKPLELLAINHSLSKRRIIFVPPMFWLFYNLHGCLIPCN